MFEFIFIAIFIISLFAEYMDAIIGMGYGTTLTPVLLLMGFSPLQIVPAILASQFMAGIFAAYLHHGAGNVYFDFTNDSEHKIIKKFRGLGYIQRSPASKIATVLVVSSVIGVLLAVYSSDVANFISRSVYSSDNGDSYNY